MTSAAHDARRQRAARVAQLRRCVVATALATFVLAVGAVAYDGPKGSSSSSTAAVRQLSSPTTNDDAISTRQS